MAASTLHADAVDPSSASRRWKRLARVPPALIALLLAATTFVLLALSSTQERSQARDQVIADTLLARESIRFQLDREAEALQKIAADLGHDPLDAAGLEPRLRQFLRRAGQVEGVALVNAQMRAAMSVPRSASRGELAGQVPADLADSAIAQARALARPVFSNAFQADRGASLALVVPVAGALPAQRFLVGVYSLDRLLDEMIPWNLAQDYEFTLSDVAGTVSARRSSVGHGRGVYMHEEPLELPGTTLRLDANSMKGAPGWIANALRAGIATLVAVLLWSLWALWRDHRGRVAAEQRAQEEAAFRRAMGDCAVIGLAACDLEGRLTYANPAFCEMVGYREDELVGRDPPAPYWTSQLHEAYRSLNPVLEGRAAKSAYETELMRKAGAPFPAAIYDAPLLDAGSRRVGWVSSIVDLTEQKQAGERERLQLERLQTAARLTTMGEMASSLAHELNQPLSAIASYLAGSLNLLEDGNADPGELAGALEKASAQTLRAGQVIRRVHEFVRQQEPRRERVSLASLLEDCRPLVELQARRSRVVAHSDVRAELPDVSGDPVMLQQVILNLTRNAIDAMSDAPAERRVLDVAAARDGDGARLTVRDFGSGILEEDSEKIFAPFFTTKAEGMGMGLSICRTIVQAHGGKLWFERRDPGVAFHLWLPAAP